MSSCALEATKIRTQGAYVDLWGALPDIPCPMIADERYVQYPPLGSANCEPEYRETPSISHVAISIPDPHLLVSRA